MRSPTPWIAALLVSVLVNGALIGFLLHRGADRPSWHATHREAPMSGPPRQGPMSGFDVRGFLAALPEAERALAERRLHENMAMMRGIGREAFEARRDAHDVLAAEPFDPEGARAALGRVREIRLGIEAQMEASLIEILAGLDPEVRAAALEAGRRQPFEGRHRRGSRPHERGSPRDGAGGPERR